VDGDLADIGVAQLRHDAADARGLGQGGGPGEDLAGDGFGVEGRVLGDVVVDRLQIGARARTSAAPGLPGLDLAGELVAGDGSAGIRGLQENALRKAVYRHRG
jgi:hypothetical protein